MNKFTNGLLVLRGVGNDPVFKNFTEYYLTGQTQEYNDFLCALYAQNAESNVKKYFQELILKDENAFSVNCSAGREISPYLRDAYLYDVNKILSAMHCLDDKPNFNLGHDISPFDCTNEEEFLFDVKKFYATNGYGQFIGNKAFYYCDGSLIPVKETSPTTLEQLKNYESEKEAIRNNLSDFVTGLPYSHMLLYGDKGTGKSSTVHAMLNLFYDKGLRLIEVKKEDLLSLDAIKRLVDGLPLKFIIFIDDFSLNECDDRTSSLKACVEGTVSSGGKNVMIVATSNRRHIVKENFSDRENSVHASDAMEEQLSLSDRFGLTVLFGSTDKAQYLSIVNQLAADYNLHTPTEKLNTLAERWALIKGGRSPRRAKQLVDLIYSCEQSGREINF